MKLLGFKLSTVSFLFLTTATCPAFTDVVNAEESDSFTVMTWNLEWFFDENTGDSYSKLGKKLAAPDRKSWDWKRDAVADSIAKINPTVAALQEVENRRVLWYLGRALDRNFKLKYREYAIQSNDYSTEQDVGF